MKKIIKIAAPAAVAVGAGVWLKKTKKRQRQSAQKIVLIAGNDPAFDASMYNVFLLKRIDNGHRLQIIKTLHEFTKCPLSSLKPLLDHGGFICGLAQTEKELLKVQLEDLGCIVELR